MENIWWTKVTNAVLFLGKIVTEVEEEQSIVLQLPEYVPWYEEMCKIVDTRICEGNLRHKLEYLNDGSEEPGKIILTEFCKPEKRENFRPSIGYPKFLGNSENVVLNERLIWVRNIPGERHNAWVDFVSNYQKAVGKKKSGAIFILEFRGDFGNIHKKGVKCLSYNDAISEYDTYVFNMLAASSVASTLCMKKYLSELISSVIGNDIELAAKCIEGDNYKVFLREPRKIIQKVIDTELRSDGENFIFDMPEEEVKKKIWKAQIKTVFPAIEEYRENFIERHQEAIQKQLPISTTYGEEYTQASEVELGTLYYMTSNGLINLTIKEQEVLKVYKNARNELAHLICLDSHKLEYLFGE